MYYFKARHPLLKVLGYLFREEANHTLQVRLHLSLNFLHTSQAAFDGMDFLVLRMVCRLTHPKSPYVHDPQQPWKQLDWHL